MTDRVWKRKHTLKLVAFAITPATVLLIATEAFATLTIGRSTQTAPDPATGQMVYTMRIGRLPWSRQSVTPVNALGFPEVEFDQIPAKDRCTHIVFVGDSFVFGDGVHGDSSFVSLIRRRVENEEPGACTRVFNLGQRGISIDKQEQLITDNGEFLQPDVVVLAQYQNDLMDLIPPSASSDSADTDPNDWHARRGLNLRNLNVVRWLSYHAFQAAIERNIHWDLLSHWSILADTTRRETAEHLMRQYEERYVALQAHLAAKDIAFGVVILPSKFDLLAGRYPEEEFFIELARRSGVPYLRAYPVLDRHRSPYPFLLYDGHLNELGNRLVAEAVSDWLYGAEPAPFPVLRGP